MTLRLRAEEVGVMMALYGMIRLVGDFGKLSRKTNEEKLRFTDLVIRDLRTSSERQGQMWLAENSEVTKAMKSRLSSAYV